MLAGQDVLAGRPTLLLALALEGLKGPEREELLALLQMRNAECGMRNGRDVGRLREMFDQAQVFAKADKLVEKYQARAEAIADEVQPIELRELLYYLVDAVLERQAASPEPELIQLS
jgi:geranylgeranyl pyrophosphate synthase